MFARTVKIEIASPDETLRPAPLEHIDNFAMRNFTNDAIFDDTLPTANGQMEIGNRVPVERLQTAMEDWFRRKGYLKSSETLYITEL